MNQSSEPDPSSSEEHTQSLSASTINATSGDMPEPDGGNDIQQMLLNTIYRVRQSIVLDRLFATTTQDLLTLLKVDRVAIYCFNPDWSGTFISEAVDESWEPLLEKQHTHPEICRNINECSRSITKSHTDTHIQSTAGGEFAKGEIFRICHDIYQSNFSDCYIQVLESYQAKAYIIVALYQGQDLWGLLAVYQNSSPRNWQTYESDLVIAVSNHLSSGIQQARLLEQVREQADQLVQFAKRQKALSQTIDKIRCSLDIQTIFQTTTQEVKQLINADRVGIYQFNDDWSGKFLTESVSPGWISLLEAQQCFPEIKENMKECSLKKQLGLTDTYLKDTEGRHFSKGEMFRICNDIYAADFSKCHLQLLESYQAKAYVIVAIYSGQKLWGLLAVYQNSGPRKWETEEINLAIEIGIQLSIGVQQREYIQQVDRQSAQLQKQTEQLKQSAKQQQALFKTIDKIRQSLNIETIFQTTTQEVRQLLDVERVAIYRFNEDWSGTFVADSISTADSGQTLEKAASVRLPPVVPNYNQALENYPRNETFVPISQGEKLWGLLIASQSATPRYWQKNETSLLAQVGVQLGIALQQAELLEITTQQSQKLKQALQELKQSQSQLIQNEKMVSLGQLVAGVAHEINNPLNFIYGNLQHLVNHTQNVLEFSKLYRERLPSDIIQELEQKLDIDFISDDLPKILNSMKMGTERIQQFVLSLRNFARHDESEMKAVNIHDGLESTLLILSHLFKSNGGRPEISLIEAYGDLPAVQCYPAQLNQVFMNIISNGIDALTERWQLAPSCPAKITTNGKSDRNEIAVNAYNKLDTVLPNNALTLRIATERSGDRVIIRIADNALGMSESVIQNIFNPFFTTKPIGKGTGMGLAISYQIVKQRHKGELVCFSEIGVGTEFYISIPIVSDPNSD